MPHVFRIPLTVFKIAETHMPVLGIHAEITHQHCYSDFHLVGLHNRLPTLLRYYCTGAVLDKSLLGIETYTRADKNPLAHSLLFPVLLGL